MSCGICQRPAAGQCVDGFIHYLTGDYGCPFNPSKPMPRNQVELPPLVMRPARVPPPHPWPNEHRVPIVEPEDEWAVLPSPAVVVTGSEGLEDLL